MTIENATPSTRIDQADMLSIIGGLYDKLVSDVADRVQATLIDNITAQLEHAMDKYPRQLSGGMKQRVSLIRTLVHDPSLLLMDEPFGALDALTRLQVRMDLEALWMRRRPTVLFITHSVEEAVGLSDRILVMGPSPGRIVEEIKVELPRPRPIVLGDAPQFAAYVEQIYAHFERLGILHGMEIPKAPHVGSSQHD
jgi:NitT/TauT family transport system ATP-binding protein